ncbi:MAG: hypothetical protein HYZ28_02655 [Myxococcales bacterium]|nr:hypothetical protein [Myxococcales bacterium]
MSSAAAVIDFEAFRRRRLEEAEKPAMRAPLGTWVPVWVWVLVWPG